jgi:hypothetical protein
MAEQITEPTVVPISPAVAEAMTQDGHEINAAPAAVEQAPATVHDTGPKTSRDVESDLAASGQQGAQHQDGQPPVRVRDIRVGNKDGRGLAITYIYATQADEYSIYQAGEVMVQFADDTAKAQTQRKSILAVSSARAEVNALEQGLACREVCDRQLAYALQLALDGETEGAKATVAAAKNFVLAKRAARGRFQYLKWSFGTAAVLIGLLFLASQLYPLQGASNDLWLAGKAGLVGAAFSIALAIRNRTVALDIDLLDNITDGTLRLLIGVTSAGVLLLLLGCGILPSLKIGEATFSGNSLTWQLVLVIGFLGGFLERLVPDLLEKKALQGNGPGMAAPMKA